METRNWKIETRKWKFEGAQARVPVLPDSHGLHLPFNLGAFARPPLALQIVEILQIQPELGIRFEVARQAQRGLRGDAPPLVHDFSNARRRHMQLQRQLLTDRPSGFMKSSRRISPGCTGGISFSDLPIFPRSPQ